MKKQATSQNLQFFIDDYFADSAVHHRRLGKSNISANVYKLQIKTTNKDLSSQWNIIYKYIIAQMKMV